MSQDKDTCQSTKLLKLKGFRIQQKIGSGSYATVYKALTDNDAHTEVAIKCIDRSKMSERLFDGIINEIKVLKLLHHDHIVSMLDFLWDDRYVYIVLEYCDGGDLSTFIKSNQKLSEFQCQQFVRQLVLALKFLWENNVCHLDLKPKNVLIKKNKLKLADFGFAQFLSPEEQSESMRGSPLYMAPEVLAGSTYNSKADLWSLGVLVYEVLFGLAPYSNCNLGQIRAQALSPSPINIPSNILSSECVDFLSRLLQKDPDKRISHDALFSHPYPDLSHYPCPESYLKAIDIVSQAVEKDKAGQCSEAFSLYCEVLNYLTPLTYEETNAEKRQSLQEKITAYKKRAEELRCSLVKEHTAGNMKTETPASPTTLSSLHVFAQNRPDLKSALEIGESGEMYLAEGNYALTLEKLKSSLNILMPLCERETSCLQLKHLLALQIKDWLSTAEHLQVLIEASRLDQEVLQATAVGGNRCCVQ